MPRIIHAMLLQKANHPHCSDSETLRVNQGEFSMFKQTEKKGTTTFLAVAALLLLTANAQAFESMQMGDWEIEITGNINGFLTNTDCDPGAGPVAGGLACGSNGVDRDLGNIRTGLLPSWFSFHGKQETSTLTTEIMIGFQPGIDGGNQGAITGSPIDGGLGLNSENLRQVYLQFGSDWGTVKIGRDIGIFGSDAILSDMTLLGVGTVSDLTAGGGNTSLGRIGVGYMYADWKGQIQYSSPDWNGFSFALAVVDPWGLVNLSGQSLDAGSFAQQGDTYGLEGKVAYEWKGPDEADPSGKVWASFIRQSLDTASASFGNEDATGFDVGAKVAFAGFEFVAYYYDGDGIGTTDFLFDAVDASGSTRDSDGGYLQATYALPGAGTKFGVSFGESNLDRGPADPLTSTLVKTNESIVVGVYHPLTESLNLVLEYTETEATAHSGAKAEETSIAIGAILFY
jgi:predicted porin